MNRYSVIRGNFPREFLLLQGTGCRWGKCTFCDYHGDTSDTPFSVNREVLKQVTGEYGVLDIINSGSAMELDPDTLAMIRQVAIGKGIHTLWFEVHYMYRHRLAAFARQFHPLTVKFRCGVETFSPTLRANWHKGIPPHVTPGDIARHFQGLCLLCCTETPGDTRERLLRDIDLAERHFEYYSVNVFCPNTTALRRNDDMLRWFLAEVYPTLQKSSKAEVLIDNTDLGVG
ncbi:MAG: hypothetical protein IKB39_05170 [Bacteroidaceae bacterium]|nr:hypothetical protein [Bacteroidaceae bacterium]